jgi:hypothetical protein
MSGGERRDDLALVSQEAAIAAVTAVAAAELGPTAAVVGALVGPFAGLAAKRLRELVGKVEGAGIGRETIVGRLENNEALAQMIAEIVRGTVESELEAKRRLLARAAIRALRDDAIVDEEAVVVRTAGALDTVDVRVLSIIARLQDPDDGRHPLVEPEEVAVEWPGGAQSVDFAFATITAAGLVRGAAPSTLGAGNGVRLTKFGRVFLDRLLEEGLEEELRRRSGQG